MKTYTAEINGRTVSCQANNPIQALEMLEARHGFQRKIKIYEREIKVYERRPTSPPPIYVYAKSPNSMRFAKAVDKEFKTVGAAKECLFRLLDLKRTAPGTEYQIRQGRSIIFSIDKEDDNG